MHKHLYFICPTDHLESKITKTFKQENYFYTSLANSVILSPETIGQINDLIEVNHVKEITFVLANDNEVILNALKNQNYCEIQGMCQLYNTIGYHLANFNFSQKVVETELPVLCDYLNEKMDELRDVISKWLIGDILINALIYNRQNNVFLQASSSLFKLNRSNLN